MSGSEHSGKNVRRHHLHSFRNRGAYSLALVSLALGIGTVGMHFLEGFSCLDAFYFTSMIATGQGPPPSISPATPAGKLFACFIAFVAAGTMVASFGFLFGPFLGKLWRIGVFKFEEEIDHLGRKK